FTSIAAACSSMPPYFRGRNSMDFEVLRYEVDECVLTLTLSRPEKLNAMNAQMGKELVEAFDAADADDNVRAIVITGEGRAFCAGADLSGGGGTFDYQSDGVHRDGGGLVTLR